MSRTLALSAGMLAGSAVWIGGAVASPPANNTTITVEEHFTGPNTIEGTFVASGFINDVGTKSETFRTKADRIEAVELLTGSRGSITIEVRGRITTPTPSTLAVLDARWKVVDGTGAYANLRGRGTVDIHVDLAAGTATNLHRGTLRLARSCN